MSWTPHYQRQAITRTEQRLEGVSLSDIAAEIVGLETDAEELRDRVAELEAELKLAQTDIQSKQTCLIEASTDPGGDYYHGLRCGVEDRQITCRYAAAEYGWQQAFEYMSSITIHEMESAR